MGCGDGMEKSEYNTKTSYPKSTKFNKDIKKIVATWIMAPVMGNSVKRTNALLGYHENFQYFDAQIQPDSWWARFKDTLSTYLIGIALYLPILQILIHVPKPGEGPSREAMDAGSLKVTTQGVMVKADGTKQKI